MKYVFTYAAGRLDHEVLLDKPPIGHARDLLRTAHQITMMQMIDALTEQYDMDNLFCTQFKRCLNTAIFHPKVLTTKEKYNT